MMKNSRSLPGIIFLFIALPVLSQDYFQQEVNYNIQVELDDKHHELSAFETIEYINHSPDDLEFIYFHLWPNAYDNNETALAKQILHAKRQELFNNEELRGYIDSLDFRVDGRKVEWEYDSDHIDICRIFLADKLKPGDRITITTPFHVKIPKGVTSRLGHIGESYQITQWYPKPAVYDRYGWHPMPYLNQGEFYSEFGSFDVKITLPDNYVVGATGDLQNKEEIEWLTGLAEQTALLDSFDTRDNDFPPSSEQTKTLHYTQKNVHDFAWFADKRFHVLKGEQEMPDSGRKVTTWAMFPNMNASLWKNSLEYIGDALYYYSKWYGEYPYNNCTAVHSALSAGGGMEYPNITVIGNVFSARMLEMVIMHEVGHNWFYGILGFNERQYAWQDEGINSFSEARYMTEKYRDDDVVYKMITNEKVAKIIGIEDLPYKAFHRLGYLLPARYNVDQSCSLYAGEYSNLNYGPIIYFKASTIFNYLKAYLGEETFDVIMKDFYNKWKYKHPYPEDVRNAFEEGSGKDLSWFFDDLLQTTRKLDYSVTNLKNGSLTIKNKGMINGPVIINGIRDDSVMYAEWSDGFEGTKSFQVPMDQDIERFEIDFKADMPELFRSNNTIRTKGMLRKVEPLHIRLLGIIEQPERTTINVLPAFAWNNYNRFSAGLLFYNSLFPGPKVEYHIMPLYAFGTNSLSGSMELAYKIQPYNAGIQTLKLYAGGKRYAWGRGTDEIFSVQRVGLNVLFRKKDPRSFVSDRFIAEMLNASDLDAILDGSEVNYNQFYTLRFSHQKGGAYHPYFFDINTELNQDYGKIGAEAGYTLHYSTANSISFRIFAGTFLYQQNNLSSLYYLSLSGIPGVNDYTFGDVFLGRLEDPSVPGFLNNQFVPTDAAFAVYTPYGLTNQWMTSLNTSADLPFISRFLPIKAFFNVAAYGNTLTPVNPDLALGNLAWEGGLKVSMMEDRLNIYLPLIMSGNLGNTLDEYYPGFGSRIRFSILLNQMNPLKTIEKMIQ